MNACVLARGTVLRPVNDLGSLVPTSFLHIHAVYDQSNRSVVVIINDILRLEFFDVCIPLSGGRSGKRRKTKRSTTRKRKKSRKKTRKGSKKMTRRRQTRYRARGGVGDEEETPLWISSALKRLVGLFFLFIYVELFVKIRSGQHPANYLTRDEFSLGNVFELAGGLKGVKLTGNVSEPKLLQVLEHTGHMDPILQPMTIPPGADNHASLIQASYPEGSATGRLAVAQRHLPHPSRKMVNLFDVEQASHYTWDIEWEVKAGEVDIRIGTNQTQVDNRGRRGMNHSADLLKLVGDTAREQITTMKQTGMLRENETSGLASVSLYNFIPAKGLIPEKWKNSWGWHRDPSVFPIPRFNDLRKTLGKAPEEQRNRVLYGPTIIGELQQNSTMIRSTLTSQIMSFTYEKGAIETSVMAHLRDESGREAKQIVKSIAPGESNTLIVDQNTGLLHKQLMAPLGVDRRCILINVWTDGDEGADGDL